MTHIRPELIAPAGDAASMQAALQAGADSVYFGADQCNMRAASKGFTAKEFPDIRNLCTSYEAKAYLALNTTIYDGELPRIRELVAKAKTAELDAVICWDMAVIEACREAAMPFHLSTQASVSNFSAVRYYAGLGASMIVPARELTLAQVKSITKEIEKESLPVAIECFVHGAMCVAVSGRCFLSQELFGKSANRGECVQPCRRSYLVTDTEEDHELILGTDFVMSPRDLCAIEFIVPLIDAGIRAFKIEGRNRSPEYVQATTAAYRKAIDFCIEERSKPGFRKRNEELIGNLKEELALVYNRGFSNGFYFGRPMDAWSEAYGSQAGEKKTYIGTVVKYYPKAGVAEILIHARGLHSGEKVLIQGPRTGSLQMRVEEFYTNDIPSRNAGKGDTVTILCEKARKNDRVYVSLPRNGDR
ncbi:MAG TPA: U32 family peptidase [Chlorobium sp.]|uniref:Peptidase U32 n=1 Tax=Chlorobium phaeovibrioides (strain DSM 265 / 1930) TaxID=290318 RepID=A4SD22_CHLPM|nr:U32 family peptidase [Chlorobium sp.]